MTGLTLRPAVPADGAAVAAIYRPYVLETDISFAYEPPTAAEMAEKIGHTTRHYPFLIAEADGEVIGYAYAAPLRDRAAYAWSCELSVYLHRDRLGEGFGPPLYRALLDTLTAQGFLSAFGCVTLPNARSEALHSKLGFTRCGVEKCSGFKLGAWRDVQWLQKLLREPVTPPPTIVPFCELPQDVLESILGGTKHARA